MPFLIVAFFVLVGLLLLGFLVRMFEAHLVYQPDPLDPDWKPDLDGLLRPEEGSVSQVRIPVPDGRSLDGLLGAPEDPRGWLLWCHGNGGNIAERLPTFVEFIREARLGVLLFDYRGFGRSSGTPSEEGLYLDALAALDFLAARGVPTGETVLFGRSLGGAVAIETARRRKVAGLVLEAPFTSVKDMAKFLFPLFPAGWFARSRFANDEKIGGIEIPILHLHGRKDTIVPFEQGERLESLVPEGRSEFVEVDAGHLDIPEAMGDEYFIRIGAFVASCLART